MLTDYLNEAPLWLRLQRLEGEGGNEGVKRLPGKSKMTMESMSEEEFRKHFRMTKGMDGANSLYFDSSFPAFII